MKQQKQVVTRMIDVRVMENVYYDMKNEELVTVTEKLFSNEQPKDLNNMKFLSTKNETLKHFKCSVSINDFFNFCLDNEFCEEI